MLRLQFNIENPYSDRWTVVKAWCGQTPLKNKCWEVELMKTNTVICFYINITHRTDHAGMRVELGFLGFQFNAMMYDRRHWNYETKDYEKYGTN